MTAVIPINVDRNVSRRDYDYLPPNTLRLTRVFYTFQGEGPYAGHPALFVRTAGCDIGAKQDCPFCDTRFDYAEGWDATAREITAYLLNPQHRPEVVVFTGGEPLLQWERICNVITYLYGQFPELKYQIETNGHLLRPGMHEVCKALGIFMVVSPKIPHTRQRLGGGGYLPLKAENLWSSHMALKYVVSESDDSNYHGVPADAIGAHLSVGVPVYVSGMTAYIRAPHLGEVASVWDHTMIDQRQTARNYRHAAKIALAYGLRVSYQMHLFGGVE